MTAKERLIGLLRGASLEAFAEDFTLLDSIVLRCADVAEEVHCLHGQPCYSAIRACLKEARSKGTT